MHLEKALHEAKKHSLDKVTTMISAELAGVYKTWAEELDATGRHEESLT